jgi:hypothetical protein
MMTSSVAGWAVAVGVVAGVAEASAAAGLNGVIFSGAPSVTAKNCENELVGVMGVPIGEQFAGSAQIDTTNPCGGSLHPISLSIDVPEGSMPVTIHVDSAILGNRMSPLIEMSGDIPPAAIATGEPVRSYRVAWTWTYQLITGAPGTLAGALMLGPVEAPLGAVALGQGSGIAKGNTGGESLSFEFSLHAQHSQSDQDGQWGKAFSNLTLTIALREFVLEDLNEDEIVDGADLGLLLSAWDSAEPAADLNGDGVVDGADLGLLLGAWTG